MRSACLFSNDYGAWTRARTAAFLCLLEILPIGAVASPALPSASPSSQAQQPAARTAATPSQFAIDISHLPPIGVSIAKEQGDFAARNPALISAIVTLLGTFAALFFSWKSTKANIEASAVNTRNSILAASAVQDAANWLKVNDAEVKELQSRIDGFYLPFMQLSQSNLLLSQELRARQSDPDTFFLMDKLFDDDWRATLPPSEEQIIALQIDNDNALVSMIEKNVLGVEEKIVPYFARAVVHYKMMRLAMDRKLGKDPRPFRRYLYPRQLNFVLELELSRLKARQRLLREQPTSCPGPMPELEIPKGPDFDLPVWPSPPIKHFSADDLKS